MPIQFIDSKSHIKKRRGHKTVLSGYYACLSCDLLLMALGVDTHTHTPTFVDEMISRNQERAPGLKRGIGIESEKYANKLEIKKYGSKLKMELSDYRTKG